MRGGARGDDRLAVDGTAHRHCNDGLLETGWELVVTDDHVLPPVDSTGWFAAALRSVSVVTQVVTNPLYERGYRDDVSAQVIAKPLPGTGGACYGTGPGRGLEDGVTRLRSTGRT